MNIYEWAEDFNYSADYNVIGSGIIYKVQDYGKDLKRLEELKNTGETTSDEYVILENRISKGIKVFEDGMFIGYATRSRR